MLFYAVNDIGQTLPKISLFIEINLSSIGLRTCFQSLV